MHFQRCHAKTMMHSEAGEAFKMNAHHVPLRQSVQEIRTGKEGGIDESE